MERRLSEIGDQRANLDTVQIDEEDLGGALERFDPPPSSLVLGEWTARLGQDLFYPPNVFGWPGGRAWLTTQAVVGRANYAAALVEGELAARPVPLDAVALAEKAGAKPELRHLANTPATLTLPQAWFDMVRTGGGVFGLSTLPGGPPDWLRPAMTVRTRLIQVKQVAAGAGVSYGHRYITPGPATLGLVPIGYAEGVPRGASGLAEVHVRGRRRRD